MRFVLVTLLTFCAGLSVAHDEPHDLMHLSAEQVVICDDGIYAELSDGLVGLTNLVVSDQGLGTWLEPGAKAKIWVCPNCGRLNSKELCSKCGFPVWSDLMGTD